MKVVFVDRDGTLSLEGGYCHPHDFQLAPWAAEGIRLLNQHGLPVIIVTNQTGIAHGRFTVKELLCCFARMIMELSQQNAFLEGMLFQAARDLNLTIRDCFMVGDAGYSDMRAGSAAGCKTVLVLTGWGKSSLLQYREDWANIEPDKIVETFLDAAKWIVSAVPKQLLTTPSSTRIIEL